MPVLRQSYASLTMILCRLLQRIQISLRAGHRVCPVCRRGNDLSELFRADITRGKNAGHVRLAGLVRNNVALLILRDTAVDAGLGLNAHRDEETVDRQLLTWDFS